MSQPSSSADRELVITRVFDAPRELVFSAWTAPQHVAAWFGPRGFSIETLEMDVRPGGVWRFVMRGPGGTLYPNRVEFVEVVAPERLVYLHGSDSDDTHRFTVTVTFDDEGGRTRLTMRQLYATTADRAYAARVYRAEEMAQQTFDRLAEYVAQLG